MDFNIESRSLLLRRDSHRIHRIHRSLLLRRNSHRFHGFTQMQANCSVNSVNSVGVFTLYKYLCGSVQSVGEYPLPVCSVCSVKSVGASLRLRGRSLLLKRNSHRELSVGALVSSAPINNRLLIGWCT